jgi:hypothetical protein
VSWKGDNNMGFSLLMGNKKAHVDYNSIYFRIFDEHMKDTSVHRGSVTWLMRTAFFGVKMVATQDLEQYRDVIDEFLSVLLTIKHIIANLTPRQLIRIFPPEKKYCKSGDWKDYFTTMSIVNAHGMDTIIGEDVDSFLWDYMNKDILEFNVISVETVSKIRQKQGKPGIAEEWAEMYGIPMYTEIEDSHTGKRYLQNVSTGESVRVRKAYPKYISRVK